MSRFYLLVFALIYSVALSGNGDGAGLDNPKEQGDEIFKINNLLNLAESSDHIDSIQVYLNQAIQLSEKSGSQKQLAHTYARSAEIYQSHNLYDKAIANFFEALQISESLGDSLKIAQFSNKIGLIYLITKVPDDALKFSSRAKEIYTALNYSLGILESTLNIGAAHQKTGDLDKALHHFKIALKYTEEPGLEPNKARLLGNIGSTYMTMGNLDSSLFYLEKALVIKEDYSPEGSIIHTLNDLAELMLLMDLPEDSKNYAQQAASRAAASGNANQLRYAHLSLSRSAEALGDYQGAHSHFLKFYQVNDSLFGVEKENLITELQVKYDTDKKDQAITTLHNEKEIANLRKTIYLFSGIFVLLIGATLYNWQRLRTKKQVKLLEKEKELDRMKTNFFANISHEFRTPLTLIMSPVETMLESNPKPQDKKYLEIIKHSGTRLLRLINQILDLSKIEAGQLNIDYQKVDLIEYLKDIALSFKSLTDSKNIQLEFHSNMEHFILSCDATKLNTVLVNLISNAIKNTKSGGLIVVDVIISHKMTEIKIKVKDTGIGISEEKLPFIFDRFYQVTSDSSSTQDSPGSGIGLALAKQLIELQNGIIEVESKLNKGTEFKITIPLEPSQLINSLPKDGLITDHIAPDPIPEATDDTTNTLTPLGDTADEKPILLIIEDNTEVRQYLKTILSKHYEVLEVEDGVKGVEAALEYIPDLIISDVMMPGIDGYEVCKRLKKDEKTSHIPIILLTAKASVDSRIAGLETEADMYLSKPFVPRELMVCIKNLLESRRRLRKRYHREVHLKPADISINSVDEQFLNRLMKVLETHYADADFTVEQLGQEVGMSRSQIHRKLQALTNESSSRFIRAFRLQRAMDMISQRAGTISEISYLVGFNSPSYFNKCFMEHYGFTPSSVLEN